MLRLPREAATIRNDFRVDLNKTQNEDEMFKRFRQIVRDKIYKKYEIPPPEQKTLEDVKTPPKEKTPEDVEAVEAAVGKNKEDFNKFIKQIHTKVSDYYDFLEYFLSHVDNTNRDVYKMYYDAPIFKLDIGNENGLKLLDDEIKKQKLNFIQNEKITPGEKEEKRKKILKIYTEQTDNDKDIDKAIQEVFKIPEKDRTELEKNLLETQKLLKEIDCQTLYSNITNIIKICVIYKRIIQESELDVCLNELLKLFEEYETNASNIEKSDNYKRYIQSVNLKSHQVNSVNTNGGAGYEESDEQMPENLDDDFNIEDAKKNMILALNNIGNLYKICNIEIKPINITGDCIINEQSPQDETIEYLKPIVNIANEAKEHYRQKFQVVYNNNNNDDDEDDKEDDEEEKAEAEAEAKAAEAEAEAAEAAEAENIKKILEILQDIHTNYEICASEENDSEDKFKEKLGEITDILNKNNNSIVSLEENLLQKLNALDLKDEFKDLLEPLIEYIILPSNTTSLRKENTDIEKQFNNATENVKYHIIMHNIPKCINKVNNIINKLIESMDKDTITEPLDKLKKSLDELKELYNKSTQPSQSGGQDDNGDQSTETNIQKTANKKIEELQTLINTYNELMKSITELSEKINDDTNDFNKILDAKKKGIEKIKKEINELTENATKIQSKFKNEQTVKIINTLVNKISKELNNFKSDKYEELYANAKDNNTGLPVDNKLHESVQKILSDKILKTEEGLIGIKHLEDEELRNQLSELKKYTDSLQEQPLSTEQLLTIQVRINGIKYIADLFIDNKDVNGDDLDSISEIVVDLYEYIKDKVKNSVIDTHKNLKEEYNKNYPAIKIARDNYKKFKNIKNDTDSKRKKLEDKLEYLFDYLYDTETSESIENIKTSIDKIKESIKKFGESINDTGDADKEPEKDDTGDADKEPEKSLNKINIELKKINTELTRINELYEEAEKAKICADKLDTQKLNEIQENKNKIDMKDRIKENFKNFLNLKKGGDDSNTEQNTLKELKNKNEEVNGKYPKLIEYHKDFNKFYNEIMKQINTLEKDRLFKINESLKKVDSFFRSLEDLMFQYKPLRYEFYRLMNEDSNTREHFRALRKALVILNKKQKQEQNEDKKLSLTILQILNSSPNIDKAIERINANMDDIVEIKNNSKTGGAEMQYMPQQQYSLLNMGSNNEMNKEVDKTRTDEKEKEVDKTLKNIHIPKTLDDMRNMLKELKGKYNTYNATVNKLKEVDEKKVDEKEVDEKEVVETKLIKSKIENQEAYILKIIDYVKKGLNAITDKHIAEFDNLKDNKYISIELDKYKNSVDKIKEDLINLGEKIDTKFIKQTSNDEKDNIVNENIDPIIKSLNELNNIYQDVSKRKDKIEDPVKYASLEYGNENIFNKLYNNYADKKDVNPDQAIDELVVRMDNNNLIPSKVLSVDLRDKIVFIFATLFIRLFSLSVIESLIEKGVIRNSKFSITGYLGLFSILLLAFTLFVNLDMYRMRIVFNYVNFHSNGTNMLLYILMLWVFGGIVYYITYQINKDLPEQNKTDLGKLRLIYRIQIISLITWIFLSLIVIIL
jgi:hypothetical protein